MSTVLLIIFTTLILYKFNSKARCYVKYTVLVLFASIVITLPIPLFLLRPRDGRNGVIPSKMFVWLCKLIGLTISSEGHENLVKNSGCVVIVNHQSVVDMLVGAVIWIHLKNCVIISDNYMFYLQPFATGLWLCGTVYIDKKNTENAKISMNKTAKLIENEKASVVVAVEGDRNFTTSKLMPFKKGPFHLAIAAKCPIQPVVVSRYTFLGKHRFDDGHIRIKFLPPVSAEGYSKENIDDLVKKSYNLFLKNIDLLNDNKEENKI